MIKGFKKFCLCLLAAGAAGGILAGCNSPANRVLSSRQEYAEQMQAAVSTPFGAYPETVVYTLGKMISTNNSNMPAGDTYEDNAYTRYIKEVINVQNRDVFEEADKQYDTNVSMAIAMNELPDIMLVSNYEDLETLIENDMIEDLTVAYQNCISDRIREMYASYGEDLIDSVTFDGKIMALPETNITDGPNLVWLRKDWMDTLGLSAPQTIEDVVEIVRQFVDNQMGGEETVGLVCDTQIAGECGYSSEYLLDLIFASYGAYPKQWITGDDGEVVYGSVTDEAKAALSYVHTLYNEGILEKNFLIHTTSNLIEMIEQGKNFHSLPDELKSTYENPARTQNTIYKRLVYDLPSDTVVNVRKSMWIHPELNRAVSAREAARLQSFPDNYIFFGTKDSVYQQIGNAVPPVLGRAVAEKVLEILGCREEYKKLRDIYEEMK